MIYWPTHLSAAGCPRSDTHPLLWLLSGFYPRGQWRCDIVALLLGIFHGGGPVGSFPKTKQWLNLSAPANHCILFISILLPFWLHPLHFLKRTALFNIGCCESTTRFYAPEVLCTATSQWPRPCGRRIRNEAPILRDSHYDISAHDRTQKTFIQKNTECRSLLADSVHISLDKQCLLGYVINGCCLHAILQLFGKPTGS